MSINITSITRVKSTIRCMECERVFNLLDEDDANEWYYGHDCEVA